MSADPPQPNRRATAGERLVAAAELAALCRYFEALERRGTFKGAAGAESEQRIGGVLDTAAMRVLGNIAGGAPRWDPKRSES